MEAQIVFLFSKYYSLKYLTKNHFCLCVICQELNIEIQRYIRRMFITSFFWMSDMLLSVSDNFDGVMFGAIPFHHKVVNSTHNNIVWCQKVYIL